jgi:molybdopterin/thiamine biosynthesis adenylyltransferase
MNNKKSHKVVFVGAGNVGLPAILSLALIMRQNNKMRCRAFIVDFDRVEKKDVNKGYYPSLVGQYKAEAAAGLIRMLYGFEAAHNFQAAVAAAESLPGLLRDADVVFNGTDSKLCAAYVSEQARNTLEIRMSTGIFGEKAIHTIEVLPEGFTLGEDSYDTAAWADSARHRCEFGTPQNTHAGVAQAFGAVTGSLAVHLMLSRNQEKENRPYVIQASGEKITQSFRSKTIKRQVTVREEIPFSYHNSLLMLYQEVAKNFGFQPADILLGFPTPIVVRRCAESPEHGIYWGFERQPAFGNCHVCGAHTYCFSSPREVCLEDVTPIASKSLKELNTPAGLAFTAWSKCGKRAQFNLPFDFKDIPQLIDFRN